MQIARTFAAEVWKEWNRDDTMRHAAAIAYYTVFALPAILLIVLSIASVTMDQATVSDELFGTISRYLGHRTAELLRTTLNNIDANRETGGWAGYVGAGLLLFAATGVMRELRAAINRIIGLKRRTRTLVQRALDYLLFFILLVITALVLIASIITGTLIGVLSQQVEAFLSVPVGVISVVHNSVTYAAITLMIFFLYFFLPSKRFPALIVLLCSIIVSSLLVIGTVAASYYVSRTGVGQAYGVAANVLILMFWIYFGTTVFLFGAELMEVTERLLTTPPKRFPLIRRILRID